MEKIAIVTDSTSDVEKEMIEKYNLKVLPLRIIYKDREYLDRLTIQPKEVYDNLENEIPTTSLPSIKDIDNLYKKLEEEGYTHVIGIVISSNLSGTYNALMMVSQNYPSITSCIFDSKSISIGEGAIVEECGDLISKGESFDTITSKLPSIRDRIKVYYVVNTLKYLIKGGRIGKISGTIGELLNIKPIISINKEGFYYTYAKVRSEKQGINKLIDIAQKKPCKIWVMHGGSPEKVKELSREVSNLSNVKRISYGEISPVSGVHTGPGLIGMVLLDI